MDRMLIRNSPAWRSIDSTFVRSFVNNSFTDKKSTPKSNSKTRRLSVRDETLLKIFSSQPDQPLNDENVNPTELYRSISQPAKTHDGAASCNGSCKTNLAATSVDNCQLVADRAAYESADAQQNLKVMSMTPPTDVAPSSAENVFAHDRALHCRLQRDLNSPSANARLRAMKALKSPTKTAYANFDVPYEEQDIITDEERKCPESIQEVMRDVVIYVEVRTGEDNRSAGVKKVISQLGARVNDKFLRDTTHVVFKDGLQSTYNKAKKWNIPIVSILWIEACKKHMVLVNPKLYPISNVERYENPELFAKIKRQKSMQPNAEENARRHKVKYSSTATSAVASKETDQAVKSSTSISIPRKPKDKLDEILSEFKEKLLGTPEFNEDLIKPDSKLLERIQKSPFIPIVRKPKDKSKIDSSRRHTILASRIDEENSDDDFEARKPITKATDLSIRKSLAFDKKSTSNRRKSKVHSPIKRRNTLAPSESPQIKPLSTATTTKSIAKTPIAKAKTPASQTHVQSATRITRRSSILKNNDDATTSSNKTAIMEESCDIDDTQFGKNPLEGAKEIHREEESRKTTFADVQLDIIENSLPNNMITPKPSNNCRRTLFTPQVMEQTSIVASQTPQPNLEKTWSVNRRRTCFNFVTPKSITAEVNETTNKSPVKEDNPKEPIMVTDNCPPSIRKSVRRRTMFSFNYSDETTTSAQEAVTLNASSAFRPVNLFDSETPTPKPGTILDELNASLTFSSTKTPGANRRQTMFDISMGIIDQRLQNINKSAKQSRLTASGRADDTEKTVNDINLLQPAIKVPAKSTANIPNQLTNDDSGRRTTTSDTFTAELNRDSLKTSTKINLDESKTSTTTTKTIRPKKRKLFVPTELLFSTPPSSLPTVDKSKSVETEVNQRKRARTDIKPTKTVKRVDNVLKKIDTIGAVKASQSRRSTLDFEQVEKFKTIKNLQPTKQPTELKSNYLVCTNMHKEQMNIVNEAIQKLGKFKLENAVNDNTTHVISLEPRRTFNLLRGILRGLWILSFDWVKESMANGKWLFEEPYEMVHFSRGVEISRSQRQAFGNKFKIDIFADVAPMYISPNSHVPPQNLEELIVLCSGRVVKDKSSAKYLLGESICNDPDKIYANPLWILDSIQDCKVKKVTKYIMTVK